LQQKIAQILCNISKRRPFWYSERLVLLLWLIYSKEVPAGDLLRTDMIVFLVVDMSRNHSTNEI